MGRLAGKERGQENAASQQDRGELCTLLFPFGVPLWRLGATISQTGELPEAAVSLTFSQMAAPCSFWISVGGRDKSSALREGAVLALENQIP